MSWWLRANVNASSVISRVKCLAILNLLITLPTRSAILSRPRSGRLSRRVAAAHQPLAGIVRGADLDEVLLIKQRQLQRIGLNEGLDLRGAQRGNPVQPARAQLVADARGSEHAPITHQAHPLQ